MSNSTRRERLESKLAKREALAGKRRDAANAAFVSAHSIAENIPLGQPILVGHHSERRMRGLYDGLARKMDAGCESAKIADLHASKAAGIREQLDRSIFSDDPDAVEAIQARIAELEAKQEVMKTANKICRNMKTTEEEKIASLRGLYPGISENSIHEMLHPTYSYERPGFPPYALANNNSNIIRLRKRIEEIQRHNDRKEAADKSGGIAISGEDFVSITFAEKPEYGIIRDLKSAGFRWGGGSWHGYREKMPESVSQLVES